MARVLLILALVVLVGLVPLLWVCCCVFGVHSFGDFPGFVLDTQPLALLFPGLAALVYLFFALFFEGSDRRLRRWGLGAMLLGHAATLTRLGMPLGQGLAQCGDRLGWASRKDLADVDSGLEQGQLLGDALSRPVVKGRKGRTRRVTLELVSLVEAETLRVGEMSGNLGEAVALALEGRRLGWRKSRAVWGVGYAVAVLACAVQVGGLVWPFVGPRMERLMGEFGLGAPAVFSWAEALGGAAGFTLNTIALLVCLVLALILAHGGWTFGRAPRFVRRILGAPGWALGYGRRRWLGRVCHELAMLLRVGTSAPRALEIVAGVTWNPWREDRLRKAAVLCNQGVELGAALREARLDPGMEWLAGTQAGAADISEAFAALGDEYAERAAWAERMALEVASLAIIAVAGLFVTCVAFGLVVPIWRLMGAVGP